MHLFIILWHKCTACVQKIDHVQNELFNLRMGNESERPTEEGHFRFQLLLEVKCCTRDVTQLYAAIKTMLCYRQAHTQTLVPLQV